MSKFSCLLELLLMLSKGKIALCCMPYAFAFSPLYRYFYFMHYWMIHMRSQSSTWKCWRIVLAYLQLFKVKIWHWMKFFFCSVCKHFGFKTSDLYSTEPIYVWFLITIFVDSFCLLEGTFLWSIGQFMHIWGLAWPNVDHS